MMRPSISPQRMLWMIVPLLLIAAAWLIALVPAQHMREDEMLSYRYTEGSLVEVIRYQATQDNQAPLWYALFRGWRTLAGDHEFTGRYLSTFLTLLTAALTYRLARGWFGEWAGVYAVIALLLSAYFIPYALEIRPYALALPLSAACMLAFDRWRACPTRRRAFSYGVTAAALLYTHYFLAFLLIVHALIDLKLLTTARRTAYLRGGVIAVGTAVVLFAPQVPVVIGQLRLLRTLAEQAGQVYGVGIGAPHTSEPTTPATIAALIDLATNGAPLAVLLVIGGGVLLAVRRRRDRLAWALALGWAIGVPALMLLINLAAAVYGERYAVYAAVGLAIALGGGLAALRPRWLGGLAAIGLFALLSAGFAERQPVRIPYRDIYTAMSATGGNVITVPPLAQVELAAFNAGRYLTLPLTDAPSGRDVWFVTHDWFGSGVQAAFAALERTRPLQQVLGRCDRSWCYLAQHLQTPPLTTPEMFTAPNGDELGLYGIDQVVIAHTAITARLWWRADAPLLDYSIGLHLLDAGDQLIGQHDGPLTLSDGTPRQTSALEPGRVYTDARSIALPALLPAGTYRLAVLVYQPWDGARLTLPDGAERWLAETFTLP